MSKYQVTGTLTVHFDVDVEAKEPEEAEDLVSSMTYDQLTAGATKLPDLEVDSVVRLKGGGRATVTR